MKKLIEINQSKQKFILGKRTSKLLQYFFIMTCLMTSLPAFAQNKVTVKGLITDTSKEPIIGAVIREKNNSQNGTTSDPDGNYQLTVEPNAVIIVSYLSMETQEIEVKGKPTINVVLNEISTI